MDQSFRTAAYVWWEMLWGLSYQRPRDGMDKKEYTDFLDDTVLIYLALSIDMQAAGDKTTAWLCRRILHGLKKRHNIEDEKDPNEMRLKNKRRVVLGLVFFCYNPNGCGGNKMTE